MTIIHTVEVQDEQSDTPDVVFAFTDAGQADTVEAELREFLPQYVEVRRYRSTPLNPSVDRALRTVSDFWNLRYFTPGDLESASTVWDVDGWRFVWNGSLTINVFELLPDGPHEVDVITLGGTVGTAGAAEQAVCDWVNGQPR